MKRITRSGSAVSQPDTNVRGLSAGAAVAGSPIREVKPSGASHGHAANIQPQDMRADIERRAYELYCRRCADGTPGCADSDWQQAERDVWATIGG